MANCEIIRDLIPLVNDQVASEESRKFVQEHCSQCVECRKLLTEKPNYDPYRDPPLDPALDLALDLAHKQRDDRIIKALKRSVYSTQLAVVVIGILLGIWFTDSNNVLYNFYIMPIVGGLAYFSLGRKSFVILPIIFGLTELFALIKAIPLLDQGLAGNFQSLADSLVTMLYFALIYTFLSALGIAIAALLSYALRRKKDEK